MQDFAELLRRLVLTPSRNRKLDYLTSYFRETPDPERGYALAVLTGDFVVRHISASLLKNMVRERVDPVLFDMSYDYVGDLAETIALIWPASVGNTSAALPSLEEVILRIKATPKTDIPQLVTPWFDHADTDTRWALIKLLTGNLRIGLSARLAKASLVALAPHPPDIVEIEEIWHGLSPPYQPLFNWLSGGAEKPVIAHKFLFHPMMLAHPVDETHDFKILQPQNFAAEWKWDGIRVQMQIHGHEKRLYSRTGEDIAISFPDLLTLTDQEDAIEDVVLDGELLAGSPEGGVRSFANLQLRLNRKSVSARMLEENPVFLRCYDILFLDGKDLRYLPYTERREHLMAWYKRRVRPRMDLSENIMFQDWQALARLRSGGHACHAHEGVMLKRLESPYLPGRPKGYWYKWKNDPRTIDAVLMYAQRGHGKRSSFFSDYTFGIWRDNELVPVGKAYSGYTDEELKQLDQWIRHNTISRFGPVSEVKKELVFELAFDQAQRSTRHKSGIALRFPRVSRIRWDKPASEADRIETLEKML